MFIATISRRMRWILTLAFVVLCAGLSSPAHAQSLDPHHPAPMQPGQNEGTVDNFVGSNYFYLTGGPGSTTITVTYKSMGLLGNAQRSSLNVELTDEKRSWVEKRTISSTQKSNTAKMVRNLKHTTKLILSLIPPSGGLVRMGGDYTVTAEGAVHFDPPLNPTELIVGTYTPQTVYDNEDSAVKFEANGTLEFASGTPGRWKLFDAGTRVYTVNYAKTRLSLKLIPGRGLVDARDPTSIVFQRNH